MASLTQEGLDHVRKNIWNGFCHRIGGLNEKDVILEAHDACKKEKMILQ